MKKLNRLLNLDIESSSSNLLALTLDWKGFDYHMPEFVIRLAFHILRYVLDFNHMTVRDRTIQFSDKKADQYR